MTPEQSAQAAQAVQVRYPFDAPGLLRGGLQLAGALRPADGWTSIALLALNLIVVVWSVDHANWVAAPNLTPVLVLAMLTGLALARLPVWGGLIFPLGLGIGLLVVVWRMVSAKAGEASVADAGQLWDRLDLWFAALKANNINIDQVPFAFGVLAAAWLLGYLGVWVFSRYRNFWGVFVLGGIGLLSNLTYLPPNASLFLGLYLFSALLLVARVQSVRRRHDWRRRGFRFDNNLGALSLADSVLLAAVALLAAFLIPAAGRIGPANNAYEFLRSPMDGWEGDFNRLFAGLPARRPLGYRIWGDTMAFQGTIQPTVTEVLRVESPTPMYWKARTYGTYTPKGWVSQETSLEAMDWAPSFTAPGDQLGRMEVNYSVTPNYASKNLFAGPRVLAANRPVEIETYDSPVYTLHLSQPQEGPALPPRLAEAVESLKEAIILSEAPVDDFALAVSLPPDLRLMEVTRVEGAVTQITVAEALPEGPDVLSVRSSLGKIGGGETYQVTSLVSVAGPEDLIKAGSDYPTWALVKYTQLPADLPQRVRDLGGRLTAQAATPYEKAKAIEDYLRSLTYTLEVDPPPFNADGVDHFLFTLQKGYSEYFASAMTVLLRTTGVPARLATGYTTGDKVADEDLYRVTDSHSHAWVEVYFPSYGWISFEPTPGADIPKAMIPSPDEASNQAGASPKEESQERLCLDFPQSCVESPETPSGSEQPASDGWRGELLDVIPWLLGALGVAGLLAGASSVLWRRYMAPSDEPRALYRRLGLLGAVGSVGPLDHQTPFQYRERLHAALPEHRDDLSLIVEAYVGDRYGAKVLSFADRRRLTEAWVRVRLPLLRRFFHRFSLGFPVRLS